MQQAQLILSIHIRNLELFSFNITKNPLKKTDTIPQNKLFFMWQYITA